MEPTSQKGKSLVEWEKYYTVEEYQKKTKRVLSCTLHFLLAFGQPDSAIINFIERNKGGAKLISQDGDCFLLTPLHIAVMKARTAVVRALALTSAVDMPDVYGWTPLHHAVLVSREIFEALPKPKKIVTTQMGGTVEDIEKLTGKRRVDHSKKNVFLDMPGTPRTSLAKLSDGELKELTGLSAYTDAVIFGAEHYKELWQQDGNGQLDLMLRYIFNAYKERIKNPPQLVVKVSKKLKATQKRVLELRAVEELGITALEYAGRYKKPVLLNSMELLLARNNPFDPYECDNVTAEEAGNAARFANHGFPNAVLAGLTVDGFKRKVLIITGVKAGKRVLWDYGISSELVWDKQQIFQRKTMRKYYEKGLKAVAQEYHDFFEHLFATVKIQKLKTPDELCMQADLLRVRLLYPLNNPAVLLDLHFSGTSKAEQALHVLEKPSKHIQNHTNTHRLPLFWVKQFLKKLIDYEIQIPCTYQPLVNAWVLSQIGPLSCLQILKGLQLIAKEGLTQDTLPPFLESLSVKLSDYDWRDDEERPLSFKNEDMKTTIPLEEAIESIMSFKDPQARLAAFENLKAFIGNLQNIS